MVSTRRRLLPLLAGLGLVGIVGLSLLLVARPPARPSGDRTVALGESLFRTRCASCHATTTEQRAGPGMAGLFQPGGPLLPASVDYGGNLPNGMPITGDNVAAYIRQGGKYQIGAMPGFNLTDAEMRALIAYLQTLER